MKAQAKLWVSAAVLITIFGAVLFAGFFAPYDPSVQDRLAPFAPPMRLHWRDASGHWHARPFVYALQPSSTELNEYTEERSQPRRLAFFVHGDTWRVLGLFTST